MVGTTGIIGMEQILLIVVLLCVMLCGSCMVLWPRMMAEFDRDNGEAASQPPAEKLWQTRLGGALLFVLAAVVLYAVLSGAPMADDPVLF